MGKTDPETSIQITQDMLDALLEQAAQRGAERGATQVLARLGLENGHAAGDVRELRSLLNAWRDARRTAWQTAIKLVTTAVLTALLVGAALQFRWMGEQP